MRILFMVLILLCSGVPASFGAGGDILWQLTDPASGRQEAKATVTDTQGNIIVTGYENLAVGTNDNYLTVKFKNDGSGVAWRAGYDKNGGSDQGTGVAVDTNGDVIMTGFVDNGINRDIHTIKYNGVTGAVVWQHTFDGYVNGNDVATSVTVDSLNNIYVAGYSQNNDGFNDYIVIRYAPDGPDQAGQPVWVRMNEGALGGNDQLLSMSTAVTAGIDGLAVTGQGWNGSSFDILTVKYDFAGVKQWEKRYSTGISYDCIGRQARIDGAGNVIVTGSADNGVDLDIYTAKYRSDDGTLLWSVTYNGAYDDEPNGLVVDTTGDVFITGYTWTLTGTNDFYTARYNGTTGALVWDMLFDAGSGGADLAVATGISVDPGSDIFVTGYTATLGKYDIQTIKYKRDNGLLLWQRAFDGADGLNERPVGIGFTQGGDVLMAGWSESAANGQDYLAIKYDAGILNAPTLLGAETLPDTSIQIAWSDNSTNENGFTIERKLGESGTFAEIATVGANVTTYTDATGLVPANLYFYRVRGYSDTAGFSHYSNEAHALTVYVAISPPAWSYTYNNPDNSEDYATAIGTGPDNHPVVTGYSLRTVGGFDYFTLKLNRSDSALIWSDLYDDPDSEMDIAKCLTVDKSSNVFVSGYASLYYAPAGMNINSIYTLKYPSSGPPSTWSGQYNGPGAIDDRATAIASSSDVAGNVVVTGYGKNAQNNEDIYLVKYNADGTRAWAATPFNGPGAGNDFPSAVAIAPDGSVVLTGYSEKISGGGFYSLFTAKYNGVTGAMIWSDIYSVVPSGDNRGSAVTVDSAGEIYVTGTATNASGNSDIYTIRYNGSGTSAVRVWERAFDGVAHGDDNGIGIIADPIDGGVVVAGTSLAAPGDHDMTLIRYGQDGTVVWPGDGSKSVQRHDNDDYATAFASDPSGYLYLAGNTDSGGTDILSYLLSHEGVLLGATSYGGAANNFDEASSIAVNAVGEAFIAGYTTNASGNADYVVMKQTNPYILVPSPFTATPPADYSIMNLSWVNNTPGTGLRIERTLGPVNAGSVWTEIATVAAGTATYQDSGLNQGTSYCYRITAFSGSLDSRKLTSCATTTLAPPIVNPVAVPSQTATDLSWLNVPGNSGYRVERMPSGGSWAQIGSNLPANTVTYHDTAVSAGTVYSYRVVTLSSAGSSLPSTVQIAPVLNATTVITSGSIAFSWPAVTGAESYRIERSSDNINWSVIATPAAVSSSYADTTVASGELYYYRLKVVTGGIASGASVVRTVSSLLKTPGFSSAAASSTTGITLLWTDPNTNETGHTVEYGYCRYYDNPVECSTVLASDGNWTAWTQVPLASDITSTTVGGLASGRSYRFRVTATRVGANSSPSALLMATPNLTAPVNLLASAVTDSSVVLTWTDILGESNYTVEQDGTLLASVLNRNSSTYTVTGLTANTSYCFRVQPYNSTSSAYSNQSCVTIYGAPVLTAVTVNSQTAVTLAWNDVTGESGYEVWQSIATYQNNQPASTTTGYWNAYTNLTTTVLPADTVSHARSDLGYGYAYKYKIRYKLPDGSFSAYSNEIMAVTIPAFPGLTPTPLSTSQIRLNWTDVNGESTYNLQQKIRAGASCATEDWSAVTSTPVVKNLTSTTVSSLLTGTVYCFRMNAANAGGSSPWSPIITTSTLLPTPVLNALTGVTQSKIDLSWNNITGNSGYRIERSLNNSTWSELALPAVDVVAWSDTTVAANQIYYYRVSTKNSLGIYSLSSNVVNATTLAVTPPVLSSLSGITTAQVTLNWGGVAENNGYKVERSLNNIAWAEVASPAAGAVSYTDSGLSAGTLYYYRVSTLNAAGSYSLPSNVMSTTTTPVAPVLSLTPISASRIDLSWQVVMGATQYRILRSTGGDGPVWDEIAQHAAGYSTLYCGLYPLPSIGCNTLVPVTTTFASEGLERDTTYCYKSAAWNASGGYSAESATVCAKTPSINGPALDSVQAQNSMKIAVGWSYNPAACTPLPCENPDGFEVWRKGWSGEWVLIDTVPVASSYLDIIGIGPQKNYSYKIRAIRGGDSSAFSNEAGVTTPAYVSGDSTCP